MSAEDAADTDGRAAGDPAPRPRRVPMSVAALGALVVGLALGVAAESRWPGLRPAIAAIEPVGALWVAAIRMTLVPLVVSLLVTSVAGVADVRALGRLGARTLGTFAVMVAVTGAFGALAAPAVFAFLDVDPATSAALRAAAAERAATAPPAIPPTLRGFVVGLAPANVVRAAVDGAMLPLLVFTATFAAASTRLAAAARDRIVAPFRAVADAMLVVVRWVLALAPLGVFALAADMGARVGVAAAGAVGFYVAALCAMLTLVVLLTYPVASAVAGIRVRTFARAAAPAQAVAVSTRSSLASLPALIDGARRALGDRPAVTGFVLPLGVAVFKFGAPVAHVVGPLFLATIYGVPLGPAQYAMMGAIAASLSFSIPGIPSGGLLAVSGTVIVAIGVPIEGLALLIAADAIPDVFLTLTNVTGDVAAAAIVGRGEDGGIGGMGGGGGRSSA